MKPATRRAPEVDDAELLARMATGNLEGLGVLYDRYERDVRRLIHRLGVSSSEADDLVQAVFLAALRTASKFDGRASARAWLLGIATMHVRRHRRSIARAMRAVASWGSTPSSPPPPGPDHALDAARAHEKLEIALARISAKEREVFLLIVAEGLGAEEVARSLGVPVGTIWRRLHYARQEIRRVLEGEAT